MNQDWVNQDWVNQDWVSQDWVVGAVDRRLADTDDRRTISGTAHAVVTILVMAT
ncbi:MAG: hypothetical protein AAF493_06660 [Pseudomonadota bacterium]